MSYNKMSSGAGVVFVTEATVNRLAGCMLALATTFVIARFTIRGIKRRYFVGEEIPIAVAWVCMTAITSTFIATAPTIFKATAVFAGQQPPYAELIKDAELIYKVFFANVLLFYSCLWGVKIALLVQCKRLIDGQQRTYTVIWWCIVGFVVASYIAVVTAYLTPCKGLLHKYFTFPSCSTTSDYRRSATVTYFAYAVDVSTDLMIIAFPIPLLSSLRLNLVRKCCVMGIFGVAAICICVATVCVAKMASTTGHNQPSPTWMAIWLIVESAFAVVVGCLPTMGLLLPPVKYNSQPKYASGMKHPPGGHSTGSSSTAHDDALGLWSHPFKFVMKRLTADNNTRFIMVAANESKAQISHVSPAPGVMVTNTFEVDEPTLSTLPPAALPPGKYTLKATDNW